MTRLICGILRLDSTPPDEALVRRMATAMIAPGLVHEIRIASRGPVAMAAIGLARRGSGTPPPPAFVEEDEALLAADISVYDRARLSLPDVGPDAEGAGSDARVLRAALAAGALGRLNGDFAFAHWRNDCLILGRDHFGARPLVFTERARQYLAFASSPAALLRTGLASVVLDEPVAASWVLQPSPPPGRTIYRDIQPVDAAHLVECCNGATTTRRYWQQDTRRRLPFDSDPRELAEETARLLTQAVERRLPPEGPGAGHLSGGLDSSPIAVLAARKLARSGRAFLGYTFREPESGPGLAGVGDAPVADLVAAAEPAITLVSVIAPGLLATYAKGIEPETLLPVSEMEPEEQILRHAAAHGATVMLSGWGGDQIVSFQGRGAQVELLRAGRLIRLVHYLRAEARGTGTSLFGLLRSTVVMQALPQKIREAVRRLFGRETPFLSTMEERVRLVAPHRRDTLLVENWADEGDTHEMRRGMAEAWYIQTRLEAFARQGARHGLIYAYPLLDLDLIEFSMQIPGPFLRSGGQRRVLFREALAGILPDEVRFSPVKLVPMPGESQRIAAERARLLAILREWRKNDRVRDYLDLDFMEQAIRSAADPAAPGDLAEVDLAAAFTIACLLTALEKGDAEAVRAGAGM
jgi:asparagine synthase (glutamine-hydrolysing)